MTPGHRARLVQIFCQVYRDTGGNLEDAVEMVALADRDRGNSTRVRRPFQTAQVSRIIQAVCEDRGIKMAALLAKSRTTDLVEARFVAMRLLRELAGVSLTKIAGSLNLSDHTTVLNGLVEVERRPELVQAVNRIRARLLAAPQNDVVAA